MENVYKDATSHSSFTAVLIGPHGVGKTRTLFWLYYQLEDKGAIAIPINKEVISKIETPKILLVDLNEINTMPPPDIHALRKLKIDVINLGGKVIFAASGSFQANAYTTNFRISSAIRNLYYSALEGIWNKASNRLCTDNSITSSC